MFRMLKSECSEKFPPIYSGCELWAHERPCFVLGYEFGPVLLAVACHLEDAIDEMDELPSAQQVDWEADKDTILDYVDSYTGDEFDPEDLSEETQLQRGFYAAMDCGEIRMNDGGTTVWVSHYEWFREFDTVREAGQFIRGEED